MSQFTLLLVIVAIVVTVAGLEDANLDLFLSQNPISTISGSANEATPSILVNNLLHANPAIFRSNRDPCPVSCSESGTNPNNWTLYNDVDRVKACDKPMLLDFSLFNQLSDSGTHKKILSCTTDSGSAVANPKMSSCSSATKGQMKKVSASSQLVWVDSVGSTNTGLITDIEVTVKQVENYLAQEAGCGTAMSFAYSDRVTVGAYVGSAIQQQGLTASALQHFTTALQGMKTVHDTVLLQLCGGNRSNRYAFGIVANAHGDLAAVQQVVQTWKNGSCVTSYTGASAGPKITFSAPVTVSNSSSSTSGKIDQALQAGSDCSTVQVQSGDSCASLAAECGITPAQFTTYNPSSTLCSTLVPGEHVCCSAGTLPDFSPKPNANGTCATYYVQSGDSCSAIAASYSLTVTHIENFNNDTWGWMGCNDLQAFSNICLSTGSPPMPAPIANAVCGPQVPGTTVPKAGTNLTTLNECLLNACCDIWGQCGTTDEFCTITKSPTGAPGTAKAGTNGCISNCGTDIVQSGAPGSFMKVAYFEGFDESRPCLSSTVDTLSGSDYTHVHMSFAGITPDFKVNVSSISDQMNIFLGMNSGFKKILSVGGWDFSTSPSTYNIFREAVKEGNRDIFVSNIVSFVKEYDLDGVDFDWEYPGEPDIPGIPAGSTEDGLNYWFFLDSLRNSFNSNSLDKSISIAAPASYWYLKQFPMDAIGLIVDYVIYMTYDLHGQWDFGNANSQPGCPGGNCLRSGVNLTETINALSMITKSGVASNKIVVGVTSYGRSFQMTTPGCSTEMCTYTGPASGAMTGPCTGTAGYLGNAEIALANATQIDSQQSFDTKSHSDILVFDSTQWVAWMADDTKAVRRALYQQLHFAGTTDWAVDLQGTASTIHNECKTLSASNATSLGDCTPVNPNTGCTAGTGNGDYKDLCEFTCGYDYCPKPFCSCTTNGTLSQKPLKNDVNACPVTRLDTSFSSLCEFACVYGYCPSDYCTTSGSEKTIFQCPNNPYTGAVFLEDSTNASCQDVGAGGILSQSIWDEIDATEQLTNYLNSYTGNNFVEDLTNPLGFGKGIDGCGQVDETTECSPQNCVLTTPGTGWIYCTAVSIINLNHVIRAMYEAVGYMPSNFSTQATTIEATFSWPPKVSDDFFLLEFMTAISTMLVVGTTLTGNVWATAAGAFLGGVVTEIMNALLQDDGSSPATNYAIEAEDWATQVQNQYDSVWDSKIDGGDKSITQVFEHGVFLDTRQIPLLTSNSTGHFTETELMENIMNIWNAAVVNKLWTAAEVFLYCYPMSEDDFNSHKDTYSPDLQAYVSSGSGYGCYLQGISDYNIIVTYGDPPGYDQLGTTDFPFTGADVIQSSYMTFALGGFNYTVPPADNVQSVVDISTTDIQNGKLWTMAGTFNLPICDPSANWSLDEFYKYMNYTGYGDVASICGCQDYADKNGKKFSDFISDGTGCSCGSVPGCCVSTGSVTTCP